MTFSMHGIIIMIRNIWQLPKDLYAYFMDLSGKYFRTYKIFLVHFVSLFFNTLCTFSIVVNNWLSHTALRKEVLYQVKQRSTKEAERYNSIILHKCSIRGISNPLFTNVCMVFYHCSVFFHGHYGTWENRILSLFLLIFSTFNF